MLNVSGIKSKDIVITHTDHTLAKKPIVATFGAADGAAYILMESKGNK
jgi:hypothetical protein